jgi:hypothetical protein
MGAINLGRQRAGTWPWVEVERERVHPRIPVVQLPKFCKDGTMEVNMSFVSRQSAILSQALA